MNSKHGMHKEQTIVREVTELVLNPLDLSIKYIQTDAFIANVHLQCPYLSCSAVFVLTGYTSLLLLPLAVI